ncbi:MAG: OsmC family peroxiredoxin [Chloroflexota bacterium]|nr:MAG: OsmC family peroxiredoxin [Chloroflexota bacterium]
MREHFKNAGEKAIVEFGADSKLVDGYATEATIRTHSLIVDEPAVLGGTDTGPNPVELVLAALGTCQEIVYATYARVLGIPFDSISISAKGTLDARGFYGVADVPAGYKEVRFDVDVRSSASREEIDRLVATVNEHCPVLDIIQRAVPIAGTYSHNGVARQ